jgi:hypothetical protein
LTFQKDIPQPQALRRPYASALSSYAAPTKRSGQSKLAAKYLICRREDKPDANCLDYVLRLGTQAEVNPEGYAAPMCLTEDNIEIDIDGISYLFLLKPLDIKLTVLRLHSVLTREP